MNDTNVIWHDGFMSKISAARPTVRWGILATGQVAAKFAEDHGAPRAYGSYAELVADPAVDVVYVATPTGHHAEDVRMCFAADKAVLCEKPRAGLRGRSDVRTIVGPGAGCQHAA